MPVQIQLRHDTAANWTAANPVLALGEMGVETDTKRFKVGDGATAWNALPYSSGLIGVNISAGTTSSVLSAVTFANSNGVSFGLNGLGVVTGTVATNYQSAGPYLTTAQPPGAYLTTAALSQDSSKYAGTGFTTATTAGTNIVGTLSNNGLSMGIPAYLTTAAGGGGLTNIKVSAGTLSSNRSDITFSNSGGVTFGLQTNGVVTASVNANFAGTGFSTSSTAGSNLVVASVDTNGIQLGIPNWLTTGGSAGAGTGFTSASTAGSDIVGTLNTNGLSLGVPAYLTNATAAFPRLDQVLDPNTDKIFSMGGSMLQLQWATGGSFSTNATREGMFELDVQGNVTAEADVVHAHQHGGAPTKLDILHVEGDGANVTGLRLQMSASVAAEINQPIKFTTEDAGYAIGSVPFIMGTGMSNSVANLNANFVQGKASSVLAGTGFTTASTAGSDIVGTMQTNGISLGIPKYLTTAAAGTGAGTNTSVVTTAGTDLSFAVNTSGVTIAYPKWITTAAATNALTAINVSASGGSANLSAITFANSNNITFGINASVITASFNDTNDSVLAGTGFTTATTAGTNIVGTLGTNGISMGVPAYLTAAAGGGGVAISNSQTLFTSGTVAFSAATAGAMTIASSAGGQSLIFSVPQTSSMVGSGPVTISTTGSTVAISVLQSSSMVGLGGISISTSGSTITISYSSSNTSAPTLGYFDNLPAFPTNTTTVSASNSVIQIVPFVLPQPMSMAFLRIPASFSFVSTSHTSTLANTTYSFNRSYSVAAVIYTNAGGNMSQIQALKSSFASWVFQTSIGAGNTGSQYTVSFNVTAPVSGNYTNYTTSVAFTNASIQISTGSLTLFTGLRWMDIPFAASLPAGNYWLGIGGSSDSASNGGPGAISAASLGPISMYAHSQTNLTFILAGAASASSVQVQPGLGSFSTNARQSTNGTVAMSNISMQASNPKLYFQMIWST